MAKSTRFSARIRYIYLWMYILPQGPFEAEKGARSSPADKGIHSETSRKQGGKMREGGGSTNRS